MLIVHHIGFFVSFMGSLSFWFLNDFESKSYVAIKSGSKVLIKYEYFSVELITSV